MPMNRSLYPPNWDVIAYVVKECAAWRCEGCDRPCRRPGEGLWDLYRRIENEHWDWVSDLDGEDENGEPTLKFGRFVLTTAHLNHNPSDCRTENLKALCSVCHCRMDLRAMETKRRLKKERLGQLSLF
ncbi:MAG: HNH endonuclease [Cyanobacteria bacterium CRU_2_1]|nr:HNH endonuclease [Cyanobacteria bacterium RU_5_0]NJR61898.1 HNH endonuclease [Cyanobacteria bacterium CRU_2_1]